RADAFIDLICARSTTVAKKPLIRVLISADTLAGSDTPGELAGYGPIDADLARGLAADGLWQRFITDPITGALRDIDPKKYKPSPALKAYVQARDRTCRFPTCQTPAHQSDIDHTTRFHNGHQPGTAENPGTAKDNLGVLCRRHHRLKDNPAGRWKYRRAGDGWTHWTTPTGRTYNTEPEPPINLDTNQTQEAPPNNIPETEETPPISIDTPGTDDGSPPF
ncbi:MAG TPA: HNH endonuclease signature motif containing protein, partial [Mycobacteriales bacterium]|nr:HNH endonuclease signature motif containing protein [Mycobacteriales bacterium]